MTCQRFDLDSNKIRLKAVDHHAFRLEKDFEARVGTLIFIAHYVQYEPLRDDLRYLNLLRRIGLGS